MKKNIILLNDFLASNLWWIIALGVLLLVILAFILERVISSSRDKRKAQKAQIEAQRGYLEYLGGAENVIDSLLEGSRIVVHLHDYSLINREKLKEAGVSGFIEKSDKLTLVVPIDSEKVYNGIFKGEDAS